jgi:hypothetical protein
MLVGAIVWGQVAWHHDDLLGYSRARKFSLYMVILVLGGICIVYILK